METIFAKVLPEHVRTEPFPHVVIPDILPTALYKELDEAFPSLEAITMGRDLDSNKRFDYTVRDARIHGNLSSTWREFLECNSSEQFFRDVTRVFGDHIKRLYPEAENKIGPLDAWRVGHRHIDSHKTHDILLDTHISINTPVTKKATSVRTAHVDDPRKLYGGLLYFRDPSDTAGGDLELYRFKNDQYKYDHQQVDRKYVEKVAQVSYDQNVLIFFLNSPHSLHGVTPRALTNSVRRFVNFVGEVEDPLFDIASRQVGSVERFLRKLKSKLYRIPIKSV